MSEVHTILGGKVRLYKREPGINWNCATYMNGKEHRKSTKEPSLARAKDFAEDWYLEMRGKLRDGLLTGEKTFRHTAGRFQEEYEVLTEGERNERWVKDHFRRIKLYLNPFFGDMPLSSITAGTAQDYRISRLRPALLHKS